VEAHLTNNFSNGNLYDSWNEILSQTTCANIQLTYEWLSSWWEVFGENERLSLITITDEGKIIGIAPLIITKVINKAGLKLRKLTFVGDGLTDYHDLLVVNDRRKEALQILLKFIVNSKENWDAIHFRNVRSDSPNLPVLRDAFQAMPLTFIERINIQSPYISIDRNWMNYYGALGRNIKSDIQRRLNYLTRMGKAEFIHLHKVDDVTNTLGIIKSIHEKCQGAKGEISWYTNDKRFRFVSLILKRFGDRKWLDIVFFKLNEKIIAYYLGFVYDNVVYFWNTGFDPEFSKMSPGKLLLHHWIKDAFEAGYKEFDFMVGEEPYKFQWTSRTRPNYELFLFKDTVRSRLLKGYYTFKPILKKNPYIKKIGAGIKSRIKD
jgi:CelD/BcsL family acetyltransferase involved in cellulose biosynthesis